MRATWRRPNERPRSRTFRANRPLRARAAAGEVAMAAAALRPARIPVARASQPRRRTARQGRCEGLGVAAAAALFEDRALVRRRARARGPDLPRARRRPAARARKPRAAARWQLDRP